MTVCDFFSGLIAGMAGLVAGYPIDTIKVRQQLVGVNMKSAVKNIYRSRGWRGFYRGLTVPMLANGVLNAVYFSVYGWTVDVMVDYREAKVEGATPEDFYTDLAVEDVNSGSIIEVESKDTAKRNSGYSYSHFRPKGFVSAAGDNHNSVQSEQATVWDCFIGGWIAGWVSLIIACPVEVIKVKLQSTLVTQHVYRNPVHVLKRVYVAQGPKGFYKGIIPLSNRNFIGAAINYSVMKACFEAYPESHNNWYQTIPVASFAGMVSWAFVIPFDVIKTRMQSDNLRKPHYKSMTNCAQRIVRKQGVKGLFRGLGLMAIRTLPVSAVSSVVYEFIQSHCHNEHRLS